MGPYTFDEVRQYLANGQVLPTDWAWHPGLGNWIPVTELPGLGLPTPAPTTIAAVESVPESDPANEAPVYHHVSMVKFIIYSICSVGIYELFWAYKNWKFIKLRDGSRIMPFWRTIFLPLWCYSLTKDIADTRGGAKVGVVSLVAGVYFFVSILWKLPDPYWLITLANFVPLLYPVNLIDEINRARGVRGAWYSRVKVRHVLSCLAGTLALALAMLGMFGPGTQVVRGEHLPERHVAWLRAMGVVKPDEAIEYFYSTAFLSRRSSGYVVTDKGLAAYEQSDGKLNVQSAAYEEIEDIDVTFSESWIDDTEVFIEPRDEDGFYLMFSTEQKLDRSCVKRLMELWKRSKPPASGETVTF